MPDTVEVKVKQKTYMIAGFDMPEAPDKFNVPQFGNATPETLVDEVARIRKWKAYFEAADKVLGTALKARIGDKKNVDGEAYKMARETVKQIRISPDLCREHLTPELLAKVEYELSIEQMRFTRK